MFYFVFLFKLFKFKDEIHPRVLLALAVLRSKQYTMLTGGSQQNIDISDLQTVNTGKGVPYSVQGEVDFFNMTDTLVTSSEYYGSSVRFSSSSHKLTMERKLGCIMRDSDDKRFILDCNFHTRAHGHYLNSVSSVCLDCSNSV